MTLDTFLFLFQLPINGYTSADRNSVANAAVILISENYKEMQILNLVCLVHFSNDIANF